jgi:hypothetical protein
MVSNALMQAHAECIESQKKLKLAQQREQRIEHVLDILNALEKDDNLNNRLLAIKKLRFYLYEQPIVTLQELCEIKHDERYLRFTPEHLDTIERDEYDCLAQACMDKIKGLSTHTNCRKTLQKLKLCNLRGNNKISAEDIQGLNSYIHQFKLSYIQKLLDELEARKGAWKDEKLGLIEDIILYIEENGIDYDELILTKEEILETCMKV